jgi:hypothetical protein
LRIGISSDSTQLLAAAIFGLMAPGIVLAAGGEREVPRPALSDQGRHGPMILRERHGRNATSGNWSGYAIPSAAGSVSDVKGSWVVPAIQSGACSSQTQYASFWVGIDGYDTSTVEQIGTDSDCQNGTPVYYAWYEFYPKFPVNIPIKIRPLDMIWAEVSYSGGKFTVSITDVTQGETYSTSEKMPNAKRASAEWIIEASGTTLPDFGTVGFGEDNTGVSGTCYATVGGATAPMDNAAFANDLVEITMVAGNGKTMSQPSGVSMDKTSFTDTWEPTGP